MPRQVRIEYAGAFYHVMARGDRREDIFDDNLDYRRFLDALSEACGKTGWRVHAYALMGNHYHLVVETPEANLVAGMTWLQGTYTARFNARHQLRGHVFGGRYKAVIVDRESDDYFRCLLDYVHLNPVRAGLVSPRGGLERYPWTSLDYYLKTPSKREPWQVVEIGLGSAGLRDSAAGRRRFLAGLEQRARLEKAEEAGLSEIEGQSLQSTLRRGWYFGSQAFGERLREVAGNTLESKRANPSYRGKEMKEHGEARAQEILARGLEAVDLHADQLSALPKSDWRKSLIALAIKRETPVKLKWISENLSMGATAGVSRYTAAMAGRVRKERKMKRLYKKLARAS
jgi:putative transposase